MALSGSNGRTDGRTDEIERGGSEKVRARVRKGTETERRKEEEERGREGEIRDKEVGGVGRETRDKR